MTTAAHNTEVAKLVTDGYATINFRKECAKVLMIDKEEIQPLVPDAYFIDHATQTITIIEVENSNLVRNERIKQWSDFWNCVDYYGWAMSFIVIVVGREPFEYDLADVWWKETVNG